MKEPCHSKVTDTVPTPALFGLGRTTIVTSYPSRLKQPRSLDNEIPRNWPRSIIESFGRGMLSRIAAWVWGIRRSARSSAILLTSCAIFDGHDPGIVMPEVGVNICATKSMYCALAGESFHSRFVCRPLLSLLHFFVESLRVNPSGRKENDGRCDCCEASLRDCRKALGSRPS